MKRLRVDERSSSYRRQLKDLRKKYVRVEKDLANGYSDIVDGDYRTACQANAIPGFDSKLWKYRFQCSDAQRGRSGGYRIIAYYREENHTLYPICVYTHNQFDNQPPFNDLKKWLQAFMESLPGLEDE